MTDTTNRITPAEARERLNAAVVNLTNEDLWRNWLDLKSRQHNYSMNNLMLLLMQKRDVSLVGGAKNFWAPLGRFPMKGTKALRVFAPMIGKKKGEDGIERTFVFGFKLVPTFDVSQTEGRDLPPQPSVDALQGEAPQGLLANLLAVAATENVSVRFDQDMPIAGAHGVYLIEDKRIDLASGLSAAQQCKTLCHELGHHFDMASTPEDMSRDILECVAESTAYVVCSSAGLDTSTYSTGYVASWTSGNVDKLRAAATRIDRTAGAILKLIDARTKEAKVA